MLRHPRLRHRGWWQRMSTVVRRRSFWVPCRDSVAIGLAAGVFFSLIPMPLQTVPAALLAVRFHGNVPIAMGACWLSNPLTQAPLMWFQCWLGEAMRRVLHIGTPHFLEGVDLNLPGVGSVTLTGFVLGVVASGVLAALAAFPLVHAFSWLMPHHLPRLRHRHRQREDCVPVDTAVSDG